MQEKQTEKKGRSCAVLNWIGIEFQFGDRNRAHPGFKEEEEDK